MRRCHMQTPQAREGVYRRSCHTAAVPRLRPPVPSAPPLYQRVPSRGHSSPGARALCLSSLFLFFLKNRTVTHPWEGLMVNKQVDKVGPHVGMGWVASAFSQGLVISNPVLHLYLLQRPWKSWLTV